MFKCFEHMHHQRRYTNGKHMERYSTPLIIREMQIKTADLFEWLQLKRPTVLNVAEFIEVLELSVHLSRNLKW